MPSAENHKQQDQKYKGLTQSKTTEEDKQLKSKIVIFQDDDSLGRQKMSNHFYDTLC